MHERSPRATRVKLAEMAIGYYEGTKGQSTILDKIAELAIEYNKCIISAGVVVQQPILTHGGKQDLTLF